MRLLIVVIAVASGVWLFGKPWAPPQTSQEPTLAAKFLFTLENAAVDESSGVAAGRLNPSTYWTHNDSGGTAEVYAFDSAGKDLATFKLSGVDARDFEDIAAATIDGKPYLYVGDIGDNLEDQKHIRIHRFPEPSLSAPARSVAVETYAVSYPDGSHNAEALMVAPNGDIYVVTKAEDGDSNVYRLPKPKGEGRYTFQKVGDLKIEGGNAFSRQVTAGDISSDGKRVVIRTYFSIMLFEVDKLEEFHKATPTSLPVPMERQGEAICFDEANRRLITTSEGSPCRVSQVSLP